MDVVCIVLVNTIEINCTYLTDSGNASYCLLFEIRSPRNLIELKI